MSNNEIVFRGAAIIHFNDGETFEHDNVFIYDSGWVLAVDDDRRYFPAHTVKMIHFVS